VHFSAWHASACFWRFPIGLIDAYSQSKNWIGSLIGLLLKLLNSTQKKRELNLCSSRYRIKKRRQISMAFSIGRIELYFPLLLSRWGNKLSWIFSGNPWKMQRKLTFESTKVLQCSPQMDQLCVANAIGTISIRGCSTYLKLAHVFDPLRERFHSLDALELRDMRESPWWGNKSWGGFRKIGSKPESISRIYLLTEKHGLSFVEELDFQLEREVAW